MNSDLSTLALVSGVTTAINAAYTIQRGGDGVVSVVAGGVAFVALATFGGLVGRMELATALAYVFLVAALFLRGLPLIQSTTTLVTKEKNA